MPALSRLSFIESTACFGGFQHRVETAQHHHRQDHIAILAAHIEIAQRVVGDAPDEVRDPVQITTTHFIPFYSPCGLFADLFGG